MSARQLLPKLPLKGYTPREIRVQSINVAAVFYMHGIEPLRMMRHDRTGAPLFCFAGNATNQDLLNRYNAGRDHAAEMIETVESETANGNADQ
jgi:hypothetical protein